MTPHRQHSFELLTSHWAITLRALHEKLRKLRVKIRRHSSSALRSRADRANFRLTQTRMPRARSIDRITSCPRRRRLVRVSALTGETRASFQQLPPCMSGREPARLPRACRGRPTLASFHRATLQTAVLRRLSRSRARGAVGHPGQRQAPHARGSRVWGLLTRHCLPREGAMRRELVHGRRRNPKSGFSQCTRRRVGEPPAGRSHQLISRPCSPPPARSPRARSESPAARAGNP